jgi:CspA family cold shock protein
VAPSSGFTIKKGFELMTQDDGPDVFVHDSAMADTTGVKSLSEGDPVEFEVTQGPKGPQAQSVRKTATPRSLGLAPRRSPAFPSISLAQARHGICRPSSAEDRSPMRGSGTMRAPWPRLSAQALIRQAWSVVSQARS